MCDAWNSTLFSRVGNHKILKALRAELSLQQFGSDLNFMCAAGLQVGLEETLIKSSWANIPQNIIESFSEVEHEIARISAERCFRTPLGLRQPQVHVLDELKRKAIEFTRDLRVSVRLDQNSVMTVSIDIESLKNPERVIFEVISEQKLLRA